MPEPIKLSFNQPFYRAVEELKKRGVVLPDKYYGELQGLHRQLNFSIAGKASLDQLQGALDSLEKAMNEGSTFAKWQKDIRVQDLGLPKHRLDNIFRTNIQAAYNRGHWENFIEHKKTRPYLMYDAINDSRVRPSHLAMDGIIRPVGDSFWATNYPPNGFRCRCRCISLNERQAQERSKNGQGLNKPISEDMTPDKGFDYNVGQDLTAGVNKAIKDSKANPVLKSVVEKTLADMPKTMTLKKLPTGLSEQDYLAAFNEIAKAPKTIEIIGKNTIVDERLFKNGRGELKITKRGREQYVRYFADTIFNADEIYETTEEFRAKKGEMLLKRRHLKTYTDGNTEFYVVVAFTWNEEEKAFIGSTAFVPMNGKDESDLVYFEKQKDGEKIK